MKSAIHLASLAVAFTLVLVFCTESVAQKGGQGKEGKGDRKPIGQNRDQRNEEEIQNLPLAFQSLSKDRLKELQVLCQRAMAWIGDVPARQSSAEEIADFFGSIDDQREAKKDAGIDDNDETRRNDALGLHVLAVLTVEQRGQLVVLLREQSEPLQQAIATRTSLGKKLQELRGAARTPRGFDYEVTKLARAFGEQEAASGLAQAQSFSGLRKSLSENQVEFFQLLRQDPKAVTAESPNVAKVRTALEKFDERDRQELFSLVARFLSFTTGAAEQNAMARSNKAVGLLSHVKQDKAAGLMAAFLNSLNLTQQRNLYVLLKSESRLRAGVLTQRQQIIAALDNLKTSSSLSQRKLTQMGAEMRELDGKLAVMQASGFESLRTSLSKAQSVFLSQQVAADAAKKKKEK